MSLAFYACLTRTTMHINLNCSLCDCRLMRQQDLEGDLNNCDLSKDHCSYNALPPLGHKLQQIWGTGHTLHHQCGSSLLPSGGRTQKPPAHGAARSSGQLRCPWSSQAPTRATHNCFRRTYSVSKPRPGALALG